MQGEAGEGGRDGLEAGEKRGRSERGRGRERAGATTKEFQ